MIEFAGGKISIDDGGEEFSTPSEGLDITGDAKDIFRKKLWKVEEGLDLANGYKSSWR